MHQCDDRRALAAGPVGASCPACWAPVRAGSSGLVRPAGSARPQCRRRWQVDFAGLRGMLVRKRVCGPAHLPGPADVGPRGGVFAGLVGSSAGWSLSPARLVRARRPVRLAQPADGVVCSPCGPLHGPSCPPGLGSKPEGALWPDANGLAAGRPVCPAHPALARNLLGLPGGSGARPNLCRLPWKGGSPARSVPARNLLQLLGPSSARHELFRLPGGFGGRRTHPVRTTRPNGSPPSGRPASGRSGPLRSGP